MNYGYDDKKFVVSTINLISLNRKSMRCMNYLLVYLIDGDKHLISRADQSYDKALKVRIFRKSYRVILMSEQVRKCS
jgi:hypothetical protein